MEPWYWMQWKSSMSHSIPTTWLDIHKILVILVFSKSLKICIHIGIELHITIRVNSQTSTLHFNQTVVDILYWIIMTSTLIVGKPGKLVQRKLYARPRVSGEIHQHSNSRRIFTRFIKGMSISVCSQGHFSAGVILLLLSNISTVFITFLVNPHWVIVTMPDCFSVVTSTNKKAYTYYSTANERQESSSYLTTSSILSWSVPKKSASSTYISSIVPLP